jgi:hypothetical protein
MQLDEVIDKTRMSVERSDEADHDIVSYHVSLGIQTISN